MEDRIQKILSEIEQFQPKNNEDLENFRIQLLSRKGDISQLFEDFKNVSPELKKEIGQKLNELKNKAQDKISSLKKRLEQPEDSSSGIIDLSLPGELVKMGSRHPVPLVRKQIIEIFSRIGFTLADGPEIEDDWHNFTALNFPENHPARDMQDTFFISPDMALRTHTSSVQVRLMETSKPPMRILAPGRVYRNEAISARAHCFFHQIEGFYIDTQVSFADLKQTLLFFAVEMFGEETKIRLRPSYFPFTEPSAEMDISCNICGGKGCNVCKQSGWVEIMGCGMIDPAVFDNCKIDSKKYSGFAFGMGVERIAMLKYQIKDLRLFSENDVRFLNQFRSA
jgi:phenylalanyl-tRNA synthetase alpha chain